MAVARSRAVKTKWLRVLLVAIGGSGVLLPPQRVFAGGGAPGSEDGKRAFAAGVALLQDPDGAKYEEAAAQFRRAYELTKSWKVLGNLALCLMHLERDGEAIEAYDKYLSAGGKEILRDERLQVERDVETLRAQVATVRLELPSGEATITDERTNSHGGKLVNKYVATAATMQLGLHPGDHVITAQFGQSTSVWRTSLAPAASASHRFEPAPPDETARSQTPSAQSGPAVQPNLASRANPSGSSADSGGGASSQRTVGYVVGGVGVVGLGVGAFFGLSTFSKWNDAKAACDDSNVCDASAARSSGNLSTLFFVAGGAATVAGAVLVLTARPSEPRAMASTWALAPAIGPGVNGFVARTAF
jgi:hypothetical protein